MSEGGYKRADKPVGTHVHDNHPLAMENDVLYPLVIQDASGRKLLLVKEDGSQEMRPEDAQAVIDIMVKEVVGFGERYRLMQELFLARLEAVTRERDELGRTSYPMTPVDALLSDLWGLFVPLESEAGILTYGEFRERVAVFKSEIAAGVEA